LLLKKVKIPATENAKKEKNVFKQIIHCFVFNIISLPKRFLIRPVHNPDDLQIHMKASVD